MVEIAVRPHRLFTRKGDDIHAELPISLQEAILGGKVRVPTPTGTVEMAIPPMTSSGRTFRLRSKGLPKKGGWGDLLVAVEIKLPEQPDPALEEFARKWKGDQAFNPRQRMEA